MGYLVLIFEHSRRGPGVGAQSAGGGGREGPARALLGASRLPSAAPPAADPRHQGPARSGRRGRGRRRVRARSGVTVRNLRDRPAAAPAHNRPRPRLGGAQPLRPLAPQAPAH